MPGLYREKAVADASTDVKAYLRALVDRAHMQPTVEHVDQVMERVISHYQLTAPERQQLESRIDKYIAVQLRSDEHRGGIHGAK